MSKSVDYFQSDKPEFLEQLLKAVKDAVICTDLKGKIIFWNESSEKMFGWNKSEAIGKNITDVIDSPDSNNKVSQIIQTVFEGKSTEGEFDVKNKKGKIFKAYVSNFPVYDDSGKICGITGIIRDITIQVIREKQLLERGEELAVQNEEISSKNKELSKLIKQVQKEKAKLQNYIDIAHVMIIALDKKGNIVMANKKASEILGYAKEELHGKNWFENFLPADKIQDVKKIFKGLISGNKRDYRLSERLTLCKDGTTRLVAWQNTLLFDENGQVIGTLSSGDDITEKRQAEQEISLLANFLDMVMEQSPFAMWVSDKNGIIVRTNKSLRTILNLSNDQIIGKYNVLDDKNLEKQGVLQLVEDVFTTNKPARFTIFWEGKNSKIEDYPKPPSIWMDVSLFPILDDEKKLKNVVCQWVDITEKVSSADALKESEKKYRSLFNNIQEGVALHEMVYDDKGKPVDFIFLDCNPTYENITSLKKENIIGKKGTDIIPNLEKKWIDFYGQIAASGKPETIIDHSEYLNKYWEVKAFSPSENQFAVAMTDVTDKRETEFALKESEEKFRFAMAAAGEGLWDWNIKTNQVYLSPGWAKILDEEDVENKFSTWESRIHPEDKEIAIKTIQEHLDGKTSYWKLEHRLKTKSGSYKYVLGRGQVVEKDKDNNPVRMIGTMFDITERKLQEEDLIKQNDFIQTVLDNLPIGLATNTINDGTVHYMNHKFEEIYGWPKAQLLEVSKFFEKIYPDEEYRKEIESRVVEDMKSGDPKKMHWENVKVTGEDGRIKYVNAVNIPLFKQNIMVSTVMDITDLKKIQEELQNHRDKLEEIVNERTKELNDKNEELQEKIQEVENMNELFVGREFRIKELKDKIEELENKIKDQ